MDLNKKLLKNENGKDVEAIILKSTHGPKIP